MTVQDHASSIVNDAGTGAKIDAPLTQDCSPAVLRGRLSLERLRALLDYDPETGHLTWRIRTSPMCDLGGVAGQSPR